MCFGGGSAPAPLTIPPPPPTSQDPQGAAAAASTAKRATSAMGDSSTNLTGPQGLAAASQNTAPKQLLGS